MFLPNPGSLNESSCWMNFKGLCQEKTCQRYLQGGEGIFCANFWSLRRKFPPCKGAWCPPCFRPLGRTEFPIALQYDEEGEVITSDNEEKRFVEARAGDHLTTPFQCEKCHFRNIYARDPILRDLQDEECLDFLRRAVMDAFWSREQSTVKSNLYEAKRGARSAGRFGFPEGSGTPPMGPFPLSDDFGMKAAMLVLDRSLDPGKYADYVQWETFRKARSAVINISQAGVSGLQKMSLVFTSETGVGYPKSQPTRFCSIGSW
jgi:hypothetical protein